MNEKGETREISGMSKTEMIPILDKIIFRSNIVDSNNDPSNNYSSSANINRNIRTAVMLRDVKPPKNAFGYKLYKWTVEVNKLFDFSRYSMTQCLSLLKDVFKVDESLLFRNRDQEEDDKSNDSAVDVKPSKRNIHKNEAERILEGMVMTNKFIITDEEIKNFELLEIEKAEKREAKARYQKPDFSQPVVPERARSTRGSADPDSRNPLKKANKYRKSRKNVLEPTVQQIRDSSRITPKPGMKVIMNCLQHNDESLWFPGVIRNVSFKKNSKKISSITINFLSDGNDLTYDHPDDLKEIIYFKMGSGKTNDIADAEEWKDLITYASDIENDDIQEIYTKRRTQDISSSSSSSSFSSSSSINDPDPISSGASRVVKAKASTGSSTASSNLSDSQQAKLLITKIKANAKSSVG